jgi:hypothetical protein
MGCPVTDSLDGSEDENQGSAQLGECFEKAFAKFENE